jgi:hypothetical protein
MDPSSLGGPPSVSISSTATSAPSPVSTSGISALPVPVPGNLNASTNSTATSSAALVNDDAAESSLAPKKKSCGRPPVWHPNAVKGIILRPTVSTQYTINRSIDGTNPKTRAQSKLLDKILAELGRYCDYNEECLHATLNPEGHAHEVLDLGLMTGTARADEIACHSKFLSDYRQVRSFLIMAFLLRTHSCVQRVQGMLVAAWAKTTTASAIKEAEDEMRIIKAAGGPAPPLLGLQAFYLASDLGWSLCLKAAYIQLYGQEPTGPDAMAERARHCRWFWEQQETDANKKIVTEAYSAYKADHQRLWGSDQDAVDVAIGDSLSAVDRQT